MQGKYRNIVLAFLFISLISIVYSNNPQEKKAFFFTENKGQVHDQNYNPRPDVLFYGNSNFINFYLKDDGVSYQLQNKQNVKKLGSDNLNIDTAQILELYRIDLKWINSNKKIQIFKGLKSDDYDNFYLTVCPNGITNVHSYESITYKNLYNNIDIVYYTKNGNLKYDYIIHPGANYNQIQFEINGAKKIEINSLGQLVIETPYGNIVEEKPKVFQNGKDIDAKWVLKNSVASFEIEHFDNHIDLIIDPLVQLWSTHYGGSMGDYGRDIATDNLNNVINVGFTESANWISTTGAHLVNIPFNYSTFLVKFNPNGNRLWGTYFGSSTLTTVESAAIDNTNNIVITGCVFTNGSNISTLNSHQSSFGGGQADAYLAKFSPIGTIIWSTYIGGNGGDQGTRNVIDQNGNIYVCGLTSTNNGTNIATLNSFQPNYGGNNTDAFLIKFNSNGIRQWGTYYGGDGGENWVNISIDNTNNNLYLFGITSSSNNLSSPNAYQLNINFGTTDNFLAKFDLQGNRIWGTYYGGTGNEFIYPAIKTDNTGNIYIGCSTTTSNNITTQNVHQINYGGGASDTYIAKFNSNGNLAWSTYYGGNSWDWIYDIVIDNYNNVFVLGETGSNNQISYGQPLYSIPTQTINNEGFIAKFNPNGQIILGTYFGESLIWKGKIDLNNNLLLTGRTQGANTIIATPGSHQAQYGGNMDSYIIKFADCPGFTLTVSNNQTLCLGNNLYLQSSVSETTAITYNWYGPNSFTSSIANPTILNVNLQNAGIYTLVATNNAGCSETRTLNISINNILAPIVSVNNGSICANSNYTITPSGGITYSIQGGNFIVNPTVTTSYNIIGFNNLGCQSSNTAIATVQVYNLPTITVNSGTVCRGNNFTITPIGANSYTIQGNAAIVSPTQNTTYTVIGTSSLGCISQNTAQSSITVYSTPTISVLNQTICLGQSAIISPSGALNYTIQGNTFTVFPTVNTSYTINGTNINGCISNTPVTLNISVNPLPTITVNSGTICQGQSFTITPTGAQNYTIQGGNSIVTPSSNTNYTILGVNNNGCYSNTFATCTVSVYANPTITNLSYSICQGQSVIINPNGALNYSIQGNNFNVNPTQNTTYTINGSSLNGCVMPIPATATVIVYNIPTISITNTAICLGQAYTINPQGANTYTIQGGNFIISPTLSTNYTVTGTSINGCITNTPATLNITVNPLPTLSVNSGTICKGQSFTLAPNGALTYTFLNGSAIVSPSITSSYSVIGSSSLGCLSSSAAISNVTVINLPTISVNSGTICQGQSFTIIPTGAQNYTIQGGSFNVSPIVNSSYTVIGTSSLGCKSGSFAQSNITVHLNPTISVNNGTICQGKSFTITPTGAISFTFQNNTNIVSPMVSSIYTVIGTNSNNCISTIAGSCFVTVLNSPTVSISNATICLGNMYNILPTGANNYTIQGGQSVVSPSITTTYSIIGSNTLGCVSPTPSYFSIEVNNGPTVTLNSGTICAGNSFTLSPSGANTYTVQGSSYIVNPTTTTTYSIIGTGTNGCISNIPAISTVSVFQKPLITVYDGSVCYGTSFNFSVNGVSAYSVLNYPLVFTPSVSGIYTIQGYSDKGCLSMNTPTAYVLVYNTPTIQILITSPTICAGSTVALESFGAQTYSWSPISANSNSIITVLNTNTQFTITGSNMYGCKKTETITVYITNCDINAPGTINIFPNPANETLTLEVSPQYIGKRFTVVSTLGQYIFQDYIRYYKQQINLQLFSEAVYYIKVEGELKPYKFLKK